jgi:lysophospholipase L1-like esterase
VVVTTIAPIHIGALAHFYNPALIPILNGIIKKAAQGREPIDVTEPLTTDNLTSDGIHLKAEGYVLWNHAVSQGIMRALGCDA